MTVNIEPLRSNNSPLEEACIDWTEIFKGAQSEPVEKRLLYLIKASGAELSVANDWVLKPSVKLWTLGGLPLTKLIKKGFSIEEVMAQTEATMGTAGSMSYLSFPQGTPEGAYDTIVRQHGHTSVAHTVQVSLVLAGLSCIVENELNSQRDLVHLARITEARAECQKNPPMVLMHPELEPFLTSIVKHTKEQIQQASEALDALKTAESKDVAPQAIPNPVGHEALSKRDHFELLHAMFPATKATVVVMTGSLRSIQKLLQAKEDPGKEREYRQLLGLIQQRLAPLWPDLFED